MQFWEMSFYSDVQLQIRNLYLSHEDSSVAREPAVESSTESTCERNLREKTALEIAAEQV